MCKPCDYAGGFQAAGVPGKTVPGKDWKKFFARPRVYRADTDREDTDYDPRFTIHIPCTIDRQSNVHYLLSGGFKLVLLVLKLLGGDGDVVPRADKPAKQLILAGQL